MKTLDEQIAEINDAIKRGEAVLAKLKEQKANECEAAEPELPKAWMPKRGQNYYTILPNGDIGVYLWYAVENDVKRYEIGNCYPTQEEAEFEVERRKVETELRKYIYEHGGGDGEFVEGESNYYLCYNEPIETFNILSVIYARTADIFCNSRDILRDAINAIGEDRIKKYYLRVK